MVKINKLKPAKAEKALEITVTKKVTKKTPSLKAQSLKEKPALSKKAKKSLLRGSDAQIISNNQTPLNQKYVESAVSAVFKCHELNKSKNALLDTEVPINLIIGAMKIVECQPHIVRAKMVNSLLTDESEICLITPDLKGEDAKNHDKNIDYYENYLREQGVTYKVTIIPYHQLRTEYLEYEMQRRLVGLYDLFLVDGRVSGFVQHKFGYTFIQQRKSPVPIEFDGNFKENFEQALLREEYHLHGNGNQTLLRVGHTEMEESAVVENIMNAYNFIEAEYPGGFANVQSLNVQISNGIYIPIYLTLKSNAGIPIPTLEKKRPKQSIRIVGELSTLEDAETVTVFPGGKVVAENEKEIRRRRKPNHLKTKLKKKAGKKILNKPVLKKKLSKKGKKTVEE